MDPMVAMLMSRSVVRQWQDAVVLVMDVVAEKVVDEESGLILQQFSQNQTKPSKIRMKTTVHVVPSVVVATGVALVMCLRGLQLTTWVAGDSSVSVCIASVAPFYP